MIGDARRVLIPRSQIAERVRELGARIASDLQSLSAATGESVVRWDDTGSPEPVDPGAEVVMIPILTGALVFTADLIRAIPLRMSIHTVAVSSYPGAATQSVGATIRGDVPRGLTGKHVIVVDDILDTGRTLAAIRDAILEQRPASLKICVLLRKERRRDSEVEADYVGFDIPDAFVVGYGLDFDGLYRNLPEILSLEEAEG
ncbi:MAG: hypoxanthine phosphoribosyltransferase [Phycisphaerales bacterium]|nr:hypoxanthine phosphoribosyltransferase [Phycisphaerales bacterium]